MHSMLKEFYDFIAKRINCYFLELSAEGSLQKGESFCLKLDDSDTVQEVSNAIKELATKENNCGEYEYQCMDGSIYRTFTLQVVDNEIIIAAQINNMTNDFLCATLRNAANVAGKPLLMISSNPIDSAKSGSIDMAANGMPFYADNLMAEIRKMADESTQLSPLEKRILDFELKRRDKKRTRSMMIFNADKYPEIHLRIECNARIMNNDISADDASYIRDGKSLVFCFIREGISFHKIEIKDAVNNITYVFKVCIIDISPEYLSGIKRNFAIDYKKTKKNCKVKLIGIGTDLVFNSNGSANVSEKLNDNTQYKCKYDERLHLYTTEEKLSDFGSGIYIEINFSGIVLPLILFPDEVKSVEMVGRRILREKFSTKKSFEIEKDGDHFYKGSQEYHAKTNLLRELRSEKRIVNERILHGKCKQPHGTDDLEIEAKELVLPLSLKQAYYDLLQSYKKNNTIPTLAYMSEELKIATENFLKEFNELYESLEEGSYLSQEQENGLLLW